MLPEGRNLWGGGDDNGPRTMALAMFKFWVLDKGNWGRGGGAVEVRFRLDQGRVIVIGTKYDPNAQPWPENRKQYRELPIHCLSEEPRIVLKSLRGVHSDLRKCRMPGIDEPVGFGRGENRGND